MVRRTRARTSGAATQPLSSVQATKSSFESIASATALARARSVSVCSVGRYRWDMEALRDVDGLFTWVTESNPLNLSDPCA